MREGRRERGRGRDGGREGGGEGGREVRKGKKKKKHSVFPLSRLSFLVKKVKMREVWRKSSSCCSVRRSSILTLVCLWRTRSHTSCGSEMG